MQLRWLLIDEADSGETVAACAEIDGLFIDAPPSARETTLLGCRPHPPLTRALDALAKGAGNPGGALHRRAIDGFVFSLDRDGAASPVMDVQLRASVTGVRPSVLSADLVDVTLDDTVTEPMPSSARPIWDLWYAGGPAEAGLWAGHSPQLRHLWSRAALAHRRTGAPDQPAGRTYVLDGRHVTDVEGFYCAIGEAINGPGGYFGLNGDALHDCLRGGYGARTPFRLVWPDAEVARTQIGDDVFRWLAEDRVEVEER